MDSSANGILEYDNTDPQKDYTMDLLLLLSTVKNSKTSSTITLEKQTYHFYPDNAFEKFYAQSNNDRSLKKITFPLIDFHNLTIEGNGATLLFHGRISPFIIDESSNITISDLIIDYTRPFYSQGLIIDSDEKGLVIDIDKLLFPHRVAGENLVFFDDNWKNDMSDMLPLIQEYDPLTKAPGYNTPTLLGKFGRGDQITDSQPAPIFEFEIKLLDENEKSSQVRLDYVKTAVPYVFKKGNVLTIQHEKRHNSAFFINSSENILIKNVQLVTAGSMGVIAQMSENIHLDGLNISLSEKSKGLISVNADATHFVNCTGTITIENSILENMLDDGTNIHGIYTVVERIVSDKEIIARIAHFQQYGLNVYKPGDIISLINKSTMKVAVELTVDSSLFADEKESLISLKFEQSISELIFVGDLLENAKRMPAAVLRNNRTGGNRPRGFLISTPGKVLIEKNHFWNSLYAIHITGDASFWFESGSVNDVTIKENTFEDCCYMAGDYVIAVTPEFEISDDAGFCFHKNIKIVDNMFKTFKDGLLTAYSVDNLVFTNNTYKKTQTYKKDHSTSQVNIEKCMNVQIEDAK